MLFHSFTFLAFLLATLVLHETVPRRWRRYVLLVASYVFYGSWNPKYTLLILASTIVDYLAARQIVRHEGTRARRLWLTVSIAVNLGILAVFKYYNFFVTTAVELTGVELSLHQLLLPVGISFYTFQSMSYTIDVYRRKAETARDFVDFALYVAFFPQLVAGPIVRAVEFLPQLIAKPARDTERIRLGIKLFLVGLFKKVVLADNLAPLVDRVHAAPLEASSGDLWIAAYAFAFQIYCDFSGYSDMAIGLAHLFGFQFPENFRRPYCARNVSEFWRRWHISLSTWLRDYLYISVGGSRRGRGRTLFNLMLTMVLGGLWHGAAWTFVVWGFLHGAFLVIHRLFRRFCERVEAVGRVASSAWLTPIFVLLTFHCWVFSMVIFRAHSIGEGLTILARMWPLAEVGQATALGALLLCAVLYAAHLIQERFDCLSGFDRLPLAARVAVLVIGFWIFVLYKPEASAPFIYFQF